MRIIANISPSAGSASASIHDYHSSLIQHESNHGLFTPFPAARYACANRNVPFSFTHAILNLSTSATPHESGFFMLTPGYRAVPIPFPSPLPPAEPLLPALMVPYLPSIRPLCSLPERRLPARHLCPGSIPWHLLQTCHQEAAIPPR
jgi:hypothetical protein